MAALTSTQQCIGLQLHHKDLACDIQRQLAPPDAGDRCVRSPRPFTRTRAAWPGCSTGSSRRSNVTLPVPAQASSRSRSPFISKKSTGSAPLIQLSRSRRPQTTAPTRLRLLERALRQRSTDRSRTVAGDPAVGRCCPAARRSDPAAAWYASPTDQPTSDWPASGASAPGSSRSCSRGSTKL